MYEECMETFLSFLAGFSLSLVFTSDASTSASNIRSNALIISAFCLGQINTLLCLCMLLMLVLASLVKTRLTF